jgi:hypothetical protein
VSNIDHRRSKKGTQRKTRRREPAASSLGVAARRIALRSGLAMDLFHQRLERAPANFAKVSIVLWHQLFAPLATLM